MAATQNRDMGSGSIPKLLAQLALPAVVAQVVNLLYNIVDRIYIGHMPEGADGRWPVYPHFDADYRVCHAVRLRRRAPRGHCHGPRR